jgi:GNAT superfamily N-acetyltransferase
MERIHPVCRPARPDDTADVMELTKTIWDGEDYVPQVWQEWLADPQGLLAVAEFQGRVVGLAKLSHLGEGDYWMQGLRTHPELEGRGIASCLTEYLLEHWLKIGDGVVRLSTASFRQPVQHLCERLGFTKMGDYIPFVAEALAEPVESFTPLGVEEVEQARLYYLQSSTAPFLAGLLDLGWQWVTPQAEYFARAAREQHAWWWQGRGGLLAVWFDDEDEVQPGWYITAIGCQVEDLAALLLDFRRLAAAQGIPRVGWNAMLLPSLEPIFAAAGYRRNWDASVYLYALEHPARPHSLVP